ncbi:PEP-CTERM sorting domain-containing protein [Alkalimonas collagenimarina]|uniref:PEP-CTERM sorting domain-containing protein n=1 Tax=Alkalimonas collagenimarina TaxID=400390 RepID=A0ABT9GY36_9GAMM|nr:PEP-CTERM sorting domain-containing protein [Alkalimonas collagenimarina]MDP4535972.1 PEP-CTERM sorting domain-containing protein [Alkalimonas collagenimarina]
MKALKPVVCAIGLVFSSLASAGPILIINGADQTTEVGTTSAVTANLTSLHEAVGNTVTVSNTILGDLSGFSQVWDVRFFNAAALDAGSQTTYQNYLSNGGGLFLMGENSSFMARNNSILSLIDMLGGGSLGFQGSCQSNQTVYAPFNEPNVVTQVNYSAAGCFDGTGTGQWITSRADGAQGSGLAFGVGSLTNAMAGSLTTILDVNFMMNQNDLPNSQELTKNLISFVGDQTEPTPVPAPASFLLLAAGLIGLRFSRKSA